MLPAGTSWLDYFGYELRAFAAVRTEKTRWLGHGQHPSLLDRNQHRML
jgi:hypothetical protein